MPVEGTKGSALEHITDAADVPATALWPVIDPTEPVEADRNKVVEHAAMPFLASTPTRTPQFLTAAEARAAFVIGQPTGGQIEVASGAYAAVPLAELLEDTPGGGTPYFGLHGSEGSSGVYFKKPGIYSLSATANYPADADGTYRAAELYVFSQIMGPVNLSAFGALIDEAIADTPAWETAMGFVSSFGSMVCIPPGHTAVDGSRAVAQIYLSHDAGNNLTVSDVWLQCRPVAVFETLD